MKITDYQNWMFIYKRVPAHYEDDPRGIRGFIVARETEIARTPILLDIEGVLKTWPQATKVIYTKHGRFVYAYNLKDGHWRQSEFS